MKIIPDHRNINPDHLHGQFAFGIETNLSGTPAMLRLWEYISNAKENSKSHKAKLAGNLSSSLMLVDTDNYFFDNTCIPVIGKYREIFKESTSFNSHPIFKNDIPYGLDRLWVNFQKQHEFNPMHNHSGVYSFVVFMKIPTVWKEQCEIPFVKESNSPKASAFEFVYTDIMGTISQYTYCLDPSFEGIMLFFPAEMMHQVYPFYNCEEERITISGNIVYDI
jgi:hypothetical protein